MSTSLSLLASPDITPNKVYAAHYPGLLRQARIYSPIYLHPGLLAYPGKSLIKYGTNSSFVTPPADARISRIV